MGNTFEDFINGEVNFARLMGIGGYHLVTKVNCTIGADGFETDLDCRFEQGGGGPREIATKPVETNVGDEASDLSADTVHCTTGILISAAANVDALQGTAVVTDPEFINNSDGDGDAEATTPTTEQVPQVDVDAQSAAIVESAEQAQGGTPTAESTTPPEQAETTPTEQTEKITVYFFQVPFPQVRDALEGGSQVPGDLAAILADTDTYDVVYVPPGGGSNGLGGP